MAADTMGDVLDWDRVMEEHIEQRARTSSVETTLADAFLVQHEAADHATSLPAKRTSTLRAAAHSGKNKNRVRGQLGSGGSRRRRRSA